MTADGPDARRRAFMSGIAAAVGGLAGCEGRGPTQAETETDTDTGTGTAATATGETDGGRGVRSHDHSAPAEGGARLSPDALSVGSDPVQRPLISNKARRLRVPEDYDSIQAAVNQIPLFVRHHFSVDVAPGTYDEDVVVPAFVNTESVAMDSEGGYVNLVGSEEDLAAVEVGSMYVAGPTGRLPLAVLGMTFLRANPYDDEDTALAFYGGGEHYVRNVRIGDRDFSVPNGVLAYAAHVHVDRVDFGQAVVHHGYSVKHGGFIMEQKVRETPSRGQVGGFAYDPEEGYIFFRGRSSTLGGNRGLVKGDEVMNGYAFDTENRVLHNVEGFPGGVEASGGPVRNAGGVGHVPRGAPSPADLGTEHGAGMVYAADGDGTHPAGALVYAVYDGDAGEVVTTELADPLGET